jgi:glycosyltransferase involved in cell wall biosynthesis
MKVLITAPNLDDSKQVGGIITVINTILSVITVEHKVFVRSPSVDDKNLFGKLRWINRIFIFAKLCLTENYDVVHVHTAMNRAALLRDVIWVFIGSFSRSKILLHLHGGKYLFEKPTSGMMNFLIDKIVKKSDAIIVLSALEKEAVVRLYHIEKPLFVLENAINTDFISSEIAKIDVEKRNDFLRLIFIGRITESKGIHDIVDALIQLNAVTTKFRFDLYGDGELKDEVIRQLSPILNSRFQYHGIVSGSSKWKALLQSDVFLLPSRYGEGLPMALLESMFLGKISVTTNDASIGLVIKSGSNGFMVKKYDPTGIKDLIWEIVNFEDNRLKAMSQEAKATILANYSTSNYIKRLEGIYSDLLT